MRKLIIPGGWYCDCRVDGAYAVLVPGAHIQTHLGNFALPGHNLLFPRIPPQGPFKIAGQHQAGAGNLEWADGAWRNVGASFGVAPVIYGWSGTLFQNTGSAGSQGYRFVDPVTGRIWTGDETYAGALFEWTRMSDVTMGFADPPAVYVRLPHKREDGKVVTVNRVLLAGPAQRVNYTRIGDQHAIAIACPDKAVLFWMTTAELHQLPLASTPQPPDPPQPPQPPEEPVPVIPDHSERVRAVDRAHPHLIQQNTPATVKEFYWRVCLALHAADPRWGMLTKSEGETHQIINGERVALDAAAYRDTDSVVDFIGSATDGPGTGSIGWDVKARRPSNLWLQPPPFVGETPQPPDPPQPQPPSLEPRVFALEQADEVIVATVEALADRVAVLENEEDTPWLSETRVRELIAAELDKLQVDGSTGRSLGHTHSIKLKVTRT